MATVWSVPISSVKEWVGPLTATAFGQPVTDFQVALLESPGPALTDTDWADPVPHPDGLIEGVGILCAEQTDHPLEFGKTYAISIQMDLGQSEPVVKNVGIVVGT